MMDNPEGSRVAGPSRREFVALGVGALVVASLPLGLRRRRALVRRTVPVMGTIAELGVVHRDPRYAHAAIDAAIAELRSVDRSMTRFSHASEIGRANSSAALKPMPLSWQTASVLQEALRWAEASDGAFDPCLAKALQLWDVGHRDVPPPQAEIRALAGRKLYRALELSDRAGRPEVFFHDPDAAIDLGGIAKGYGVDRAVAALRAYGISDGLVNVGGDLYALGHSEDGGPWRVGIRDPEAPSRIIHVIDATDEAVATSGDYIQFFQHGGRRYHHMLDPVTGEPKQTRMRSVTVTAETCMAADVAGTAVFGMTGQAAHELLDRRAPAARIVHQL